MEKSKVATVVYIVDDDATRALARDLGARLFLSKPVDDQALLDAIDWVTDAASSHGELRAD